MGTMEGQTAVGEMPEPKGFGARFAGIFMSPGETFADIVRKPDFVLPLILAMVVVVLSGEIALSKIDMASIVNWGIEHSSRAGTVTPAQAQQAAKMYTVVGHVLGVLRVPVVTLLMALIGLITARAVYGSKTTFKTAFSVSTYAYLVTIPYHAISALMVVFGDPQHTISNPSNPSPTGLGFFLDPLTVSKSLLAGVGGTSGVELFTFWFMALLGIGFAAAVGRQAKATSVFVVYFSIWVVWNLIWMGLGSFG